MFSLGRKHWFMLKSVSDITACKKESSWKSVSAFYLIWYVNWYPKQREPEKLLYNHHLSSFNWKVLSKRVYLKSDIKVHHYIQLYKKLVSVTDWWMDWRMDKIKCTSNFVSVVNKQQLYCVTCLNQM